MIYEPKSNILHKESHSLFVVMEMTIESHEVWIMALEGWCLGDEIALAIWYGKQHVNEVLMYEGL